MRYKDKSKEYIDLKLNTSSKYYYQIKLVDEIKKKLLNSHKTAGMLVLPTGGGKTRVAVTSAIDVAINDGYKILWIAHRHMLLEQAEKTFYEFSNLTTKDISIKTISGKHLPIDAISNKDNVIIIGNLSMGLKESPDHKTKKTLKNRVFKKEQKWLIIVDEAHHSLAKSYKEWIGLDSQYSNKTVGWLRKYRKENIKILGLTATPSFIVENNINLYDENKTSELACMYDYNMIGSISTQELINKGVLSLPKFITIDTDILLDVKDILKQIEFSTLNADAPVEEFLLEKYLNEYIAENVERNRLILKTYLNGYKNINFKNSPTLIFASTINNAESLKEIFKAYDIATDVIHSKRADNDKIIQEFRDGIIKVLINVQILTEGSDIPEIENVFISRVTNSKILFKQMVGRALRGLGSGGTENANIITFKDNIINHHKDFFSNQQFGDRLFEEHEEEKIKTKSKDRENQEKLKFTDKNLSEIYEKFIAVLDEDEKISLTSAIPLGYYDLDKANSTIHVYEHQLESYINFIQTYNQDMFIVDNSLKILKHKFFNKENMLFEVMDDEIKAFISYIKEIGIIPKFIKFEFKSKLSKEINDIASKTSDILELKKEFESSKYAKDFYNINQFIQECQNIVEKSENVAKPLKEIIIKEDEYLNYTFDVHRHDEEEIFKNASDKICKNLGIDNLKYSPDRFGWTKEAYKTYWGMAYYFADGCSNRITDKSKVRIEINKLLQLREIDSKVIECIVYHELLHTELGISHTKEFRRYEAIFPDFEEHWHTLYNIMRGQIVGMDNIQTLNDWIIYNADTTYSIDEIKSIIKENKFILPNAKELVELVSEDGKFYRKSIKEKPIYFISNNFKYVYTQYKNIQNYNDDMKLTLIIKNKEK